MKAALFAIVMSVSPALLANDTIPIVIGGEKYNCTKDQSPVVTCHCRYGLGPSWELYRLTVNGMMTTYDSLDGGMGTSQAGVIFDCESALDAHPACN